MKPSLGQYLMGSASALNKDIAPHLQGYAVGHVGTLGLLMVLMAQEAERAVDTLVNEQDAICAVFADAAQAPLPGSLRQRLGAAAAITRTSLRVSDLEKQSAALKLLLIELHETLEPIAFDWAEALEKRVWEILKLGADCRALYLPSL